MKKILSIILTIFVFFTTTTSIFAITNTSETTSALFPKMEDEIYVSSLVDSDSYNSEFFISNVEEILVESEDDVLCAYSFNFTITDTSNASTDITESWIIKQKTNGYEYIVTDGINTNVIYVDSNQYVYLDESPVMIEYSEDTSTATASENSTNSTSYQMNILGNSPQARGLYLVQSTPRKGNASDYTAGQATTYPTLATSTQIKKITQSALLSLVVKFVSPAGFSWKKIAVTTVTTASKWMVNNGYGSATKLYLKEIKWRHKDSTSVGYYSSMTIWKVRHYFITPTKSNICSETWYHNWQ